MRKLYLLLIIVLFTALFLTIYNPLQKEQVNIISEDSTSTAVIDKYEALALLNQRSDYKVYAIEDIISSPDKKKVCILAYVGIDPYILFLVDSNGDNLQEIEHANNCIWSENSRYIAYNHPNADIGPINIHVYDVASDKILKLLTGDWNGYMGDYFLSYPNAPIWIDNNSLEVTYTEISPDKLDSGEGLKKIVKIDQTN